MGAGHLVHPLPCCARTRLFAAFVERYRRPWPTRWATSARTSTPSQHRVPGAVPVTPGRPVQPASTPLREAWEANAAQWLSWAGAPGHDSYWRFYRESLTLGVPDERW